MITPRFSWVIPDEWTDNWYNTFVTLVLAIEDRIYTLAVSGASIFSTDIEVTLAGAGLIVKTPDGSKRYRIAVADDGVLTTELVP